MYNISIDHQETNNDNITIYAYTSQAGVFLRDNREHTYNLTQFPHNQ
jgi:hypothetical protein